MIPANQIGVLIADDHPVFRKGLVELIGEDSRFLVVGETGDGSRILLMIRELKPDVLLLDLNMPGASGLDVAASIQGENIPVKVIILTMHKEEAILNKVMDLGVRGYILKESAVQDVLDGIMAVARDEYFISPALSQFLLKRRAGTERLLYERPELEKLSATEKRILKLVSENKSSKEIAAQLFISVRTVENHRMNICNKLNLHGSNGLLRFALENRSSL